MPKPIFVLAYNKFLTKSAADISSNSYLVMRKVDLTCVHACSVWHDTAIPFNEVIQQFEDWMAQHHLWEKDLNGRLNKAAFVTW